MEDASQPLAIGLDLGTSGVKGTITLYTERQVPPQAPINQFVATLRLSGFTEVESGALLKVLP